MLSLHRYQVLALRHLEFTWDGEKPYKVDKRYRNRICLPELRTFGLIVRGYQGSQQGPWITNLTTLMLGIASVIHAPHTDPVVTVRVPKGIPHEAVAACLKKLITYTTEQDHLSVSEALEKAASESERH